MIKEYLAEAEERMNKSAEALKRELATLRAGRATPALLDKIQVDYYGAMTPLNQMANISAPESLNSIFFLLVLFFSNHPFTSLFLKAFIAYPIW